MGDDCSHGSGTSSEPEGVMPFLARYGWSGLDACGTSGCVRHAPWIRPNEGSDREERSVGSGERRLTVEDEDSAGIANAFEISLLVPELAQKIGRYSSM